MSDKLVYSQKRPLAIHDVFKGSQVSPVASETVSFFVLSTGVASSGEAAGTVVLGQLSKAPVLNKLGDRIGSNDATLFDTSVTFSDGVMVAAQEKTFIMDGLADDRITKTVERLTTNGDWALDYESGLLLVKKASTADSVSVTYKTRIAPSVAGQTALYTAYEAKSFSITGAQNDYNVATQQTLFVTPKTKVIIKTDIAATLELNASTGVGQIVTTAGEQLTLEDFPISNIFITTTADTAVRIISFS